MKACTWSMWNVFSTLPNSVIESVDQNLKQIICVGISLDETMFAIGTWTNDTQLWSSQKKKVIKIFKTSYHTKSIAFSTDNQQLATLDRIDNCSIWDIQADKMTSISLSTMPDNIYYDRIENKNDKLELLTSDQNRQYTYRWAISPFQEPVKLAQEEYIEYSHYSQNMTKTSDNYEIKVDSEYRLLISSAENSQKCIQVLEIPHNCFNQNNPHLACYLNLVFIWQYTKDIIIVNISEIKKQLLLM